MMFEDINYEIRPLRLKHMYSSLHLEKEQTSCVFVCREKEHFVKVNWKESFQPSTGTKSREKEVKRNRIESLDPFYCF